MNNLITHSSGAASERPLWMRALVLAAIWTLVLQPMVSSAQLSQTPLFTVTSAPPNVMLMFDDSSSMNRLDLNPPPAFANPTFSLGFLDTSPNPDIQLPALKLNTVGYFGISGQRYEFAGNTSYDSRWRFEQEEVLLRSAAFNPLAYNPAIRYQPWNDNGTRFPNSAFGGSTNIAAGALTEWDPRKLPPSMGGGTVTSRTAPSQGVLEHGPVDRIENRSWPAPVAGSVAYIGLFDRLSRAGADGYAPSGVDLFTSTATFANPNCGLPTPTTNYGWYCPAGSAFLSPGETCNALNVGNPSANGRTCCTSLDNTPTYPTVTGSVFGYFPNPPLGPPPSMSGPGGETCNPGTPTPTGATSTGSGPPCIDLPPYPVACADPSMEGCTVDPPLTCTPFTTYRWRCDYNYVMTVNSYTCSPANTSAQFCGSSPGTPTCSGPAALTTTSDAVNNGGYWTPARYVVYDGPAARSAADISDLSNYRMIMVDRKFGWIGAARVPSGTNPSDAVGKWYVVDAVTGQPAPAEARPDCPLSDAFGPWCSFEQEAQNYANWFTYYRTRLFAAIGVMSEVASGLIGPEQFMRMGYGRINYFPNGRNNWNVDSFTDRNPATLPMIDGASNVGAVERGVRPFTVNEPPLSAILNPARQAVFDWLFTINGLGPTPNREAMHAAGLYFTRTDSTGPWGMFPGTGTEAPSAHLWCRRNFTLLATDGEWTRLASTQPLLESGALAGTRSPLVGPGSVSVSMSIDGPAITGFDRDNPASTFAYTYVAGSEPQVSGGYGSSDTETLTDVLHYYWARDLRPDLQNSISNRRTPRNEAFWQHISAFVVGYGVKASMDSPTLRNGFNWASPPVLVNWPEVGSEACRQLDENADDPGMVAGTCTPTVTPSGNRLNDSLRGGLASGGDFFAATSPQELKASLIAVVRMIGADPASGTSPGLTSSTVGAGNLIIESSFRTNIWDGAVSAFDQVDQLRFLRGLIPAPTAIWSANFDTFDNRPIYSSTAIQTPILFNWASLTGPQQTALGSSLVLDYLRGDQSRETYFVTGLFRTRPNSILGDIVNSTPLYSKATDHAYLRRPAASVVTPAASTQGNDIYDTYLAYKRTTRTPVAMFGANDGMFHVLDARPLPTSGREIFAFVPRATYFNLSQLASPSYTHQYYVDGPVIESDVFDGTAWKTIAIGTTGAGAAGIFAIDITSPQSGFGLGNVLWDIVPSEHTSPDVRSDLGNVLQPGVIGSVKDIAAPNGAGRWVYMVGNGYESVSKQATLFVFDAFDGTLIKAIKTNIGSAATPNGLGGITPVFDGNRNIVAVYGGDKLGNMWKFDFSSGYINDPNGAGTPPSGWEIFNKASGADAPLFTATDSSDVPQPITAAPRITPHGISGLHIGFGTGKLFESTDLISTQEQAIYVVWDKGQVPTVAKASLQPIALQDVLLDDDADPMTPDVAFRRLNASDLAAYDWTMEGFYIPLKREGGPNEGERVVAPGVLDAGVLSFTSFAPANAGADLCTPGGTSHVYRFNLLGGLGEAGFLGVAGPVVGRRVQPGLVNTAPPIYDPVAVTGPPVDTMSVADVKAMLATPKYRQQSGRAVQQGAVGTCAHVGLKVDGTVARIPTACAGLIPLRTWRPVR